MARGLFGRKNDQSRAPAASLKRHEGTMGPIRGATALIPLKL